MPKVVALKGTKKVRQISSGNRTQITVLGCVSCVNTKLFAPSNRHGRRSHIVEHHGGSGSQQKPGEEHASLLRMERWKMHPRQLMQVQTLRVPQRGPQSHAVYDIQPKEVANNQADSVNVTANAVNSDGCHEYINY